MAVTVDRWNGRVMDTAGGSRNRFNADNARSLRQPPSIWEGIGMDMKMTVGTSVASRLIGMQNRFGLTRNLSAIGMHGASGAFGLLGKILGTASNLYWPIATARETYQAVASVGRMRRGEISYTAGSPAFEAAQDAVGQVYYRNNRARAMEVIRKGAFGMQGAFGNEAMLFHGLG